MREVMKRYWSFLYFSPRRKSFFVFYCFPIVFLGVLVHALDSVIAIYVFHPLICTIVNLSVLYFFFDGINSRVIGHDRSYRCEKKCPLHKLRVIGGLRNILYKVWSRRRNVSVL